MAPVVKMYTSQFCPFCRRAEQLLHARGVTDIEKLRVDTDPTLRVEMMQITHRRTVPQIFIGDYHVGGCEELIALDHDGRLAALLHLPG